MQIPNTSDNIETHGQAIHDFVFQARGLRVPREMVKDRIDSQVKEAHRLEFFQKMIENRFKFHL